MHKLEALKEMLVAELEKYGDKTELNVGDLAIIDTLAHATKNLCKVIDGEEDGYSGRYYDGDMRRGYRMDGHAYAGRKRDSMGRYSRTAEDVIGQLENMMDSAPDDRTRNKIRDLIHEMKNV